MNKMIVAIVLISSLVSGCAFRVNNWELAAAQKECETKGGVDYLYFDIHTVAVCLDGSYIKINPKGL